MYYQPTPISWNNYHFLIMSAPDDLSMKRCIKVSRHIRIAQVDRGKEGGKARDQGYWGQGDIRTQDANE